MVKLKRKWIAAILLTFAVFCSSVYAVASLISAQKKVVGIEEVMQSTNENRIWTIQGQIDRRSLIHRPLDGKLQFQLTSTQGKKISVILLGSPPKGIVGNSNVIVTGKYAVEGVFLAESVCVSCY